MSSVRADDGNIEVYHRGVVKEGYLEGDIVVLYCSGSRTTVRTPGNRITLKSIQGGFLDSRYHNAPMQFNSGA